MTIQEKLQIIDKYTFSGVPEERISDLCKELNINEDLLNEYLAGQTMCMLGAVVYPDDIKRYIKGLPNND